MPILFPQKDADVALLRSLAAFALLTQDSRGLFTPGTPPKAILNLLQPATGGDRSTEELRKAILLEQVAGPIPAGPPFAESFLLEAGRKLQLHQFLVGELDLASSRNAFTRERLALSFNHQVFGPGGLEELVPVSASPALRNAVEVFTRMGISNIRRFSSQDTDALLELHQSLHGQNGNARLTGPQLDKLNQALVDHHIFVTPNVEGVREAMDGEVSRLRSGVTPSRQRVIGFTAAVPELRDTEERFENLIRSAQERLAPANVRAADAEFQRRNANDAGKNRPESRVTIGR